MSVLAAEVSLSLTTCRDGMLVTFSGVGGEIGELINFGFCAVSVVLNLCMSNIYEE